VILLFFFGGLAAAAPFLAAKVREDRRRRLLAGQLRQSLQNMIHALRVGVSFPQALVYASQEGEAPLVEAWRWLRQSLEIGKPMSDALEELGRRVPLKEMGWFVAAVQITQSTGGSLADVLETLAATLQEQQTLREKVSALTAQGKVSGILLSLLPFAVLAAMYLIAPAMVAPMFTSTWGQWMLGGMMLFLALGAVCIYAIVSIRVD